MANRPLYSVGRVAEALYQLRCMRGSLATKSLVKMHLDYAEAACVNALASIGVEIGPKAEDADQLKLTLTDIDLGRDVKISKPREVPNDRSPLEFSLSQAAQDSGSNDEFRELSRFHLFCMRARYHGMVEEDPDLPVYPWIEARGHHSLVDMREAAELFVQWQREANSKVLKNVQPLGELIAQLFEGKS